MQRTAVCIVTILTNPIVFSSYKSINLLYANILLCMFNDNSYFTNVRMRTR